MDMQWCMWRRDTLGLTKDQPTGGRLQPVLMRHTPKLSVKTRGGGGGGGWGWIWGGSAGGCRGGISAGGGGFPRWGDLRATHYYHMHTSWGVVCLGVGGYGGMYAIIALSRPCREESLKGRRVAPRLGAGGQEALTGAKAGPRADVCS